MNLDESLREIVNSLMYKSFRVGLDGKPIGNQWDKNGTEAIAKIKALVVESLPKEVSVTDEDFNIPKGEPVSISLLRADCYNQCLGEIRSIFE